LRNSTAEAILRFSGAMACFIKSSIPGQPGNSLAIGT
jgi:hypothetical protein